jgi:glycosyltransferase involved in cell wall biosynthesis
MRLAWFTPWPPQRSGIAGRSAELVPLLAARGHGLDVYVDATRVPVAPRPADDLVQPGDVRVRSAHDFIWRQHRHPYDLAVYQVGNSELHDFIWPYLYRWPGLSILHDNRLHHARGRAWLAAKRPDAYRAEFAWSHPNVSPEAAELGVLGLGGAYLYGWPMTRGVLSASRLVVTHAPGAVTELLEAGGQAPIAAVPLGEGRDAPWTAGERQAARVRLGLPADRLVVGVFGSLTAEKRVPQALRAIAGVRARWPQVHLLLAGSPTADVDLVQLVADLDLADAVTVAGDLDDAAFDAAIAAVDVSLNLRWPSALETSGPWLRALAAARPTVILDLPHLAHVPSLDPRGWTLHRPAPAGLRDSDAVAVALDVLDEEHSLRLALQRLATDAALCATLGRHARAYWEAHHTVAAMVRGLDDAIHRAAALPDPPCVLPDAVRSDPLAHARGLVGPFGDEVGAAVRMLGGHAC